MEPLDDWESEVLGILRNQGPLPMAFIFHVINETRRSQGLPVWDENSPEIRDWFGQHFSVYGAVWGNDD